MKSGEIPTSAFSTAYDPSDLPGGSVDPLGFEMGYIALADVILPGLTTITDTPRYLPMLAAGVMIARLKEGDGGLDVHAEDRIVEKLLRMERLWALASVLHWRTSKSGKDDSHSGIRGITYARFQTDRIASRNDSQIKPDFIFLRRQRIAGALGVYRSLMESAGFLFRGEWRLTTDLGLSLAHAFMANTHIPNSILRSVVDGVEVPVSSLRAWGDRANPKEPLSGTESKVLGDGLWSHLHRTCTLKLMRPFSQMFKEPDGELRAMRLMLGVINQKRRLPKVPAAVLSEIESTLRVILAYEEAYKLMLLGFERLLWLVRQNAGGIPLKQIGRDQILSQVTRDFPEVAQRLETARHKAKALPNDAVKAITDAFEAVMTIQAESIDPNRMIQAILARHKEVQEGKFDRGRRKSPWIVEDQGYYRLTFARAGGLGYEAIDIDQIGSHDYRLRNGLKFVRALESRR